MAQGPTEAETAGLSMEHDERCIAREALLDRVQLL